MKKRKIEIFRNFKIYFTVFVIILCLDFGLTMIGTSIHGIDIESNPNTKLIIQGSTFALLTWISVIIGVLYLIWLLFQYNDGSVYSDLSIACCWIVLLFWFLCGPLGWVGLFADFQIAPYVDYNAILKLIPWS